MFKPITDKITHELLSNQMPFYCCWLVDVTDESKPCASSVIVGSAMYSAAWTASFELADKIWLN